MGLLLLLALNYWARHSLPNVAGGFVGLTLVVTGVAIPFMVACRVSRQCSYSHVSWFGLIAACIACALSVGVYWMWPGIFDREPWSSLPVVLVVAVGAWAPRWIHGIMDKQKLEPIIPHRIA